MARDVPQSLWMVNSAIITNSASIIKGSDCEIVEEDVHSPPFVNVQQSQQQERKGRNSVEEIVCFAVKKVLGCSECHLHACGREDINVRCLG